MGKKGMEDVVNMAERMEKYSQGWQKGKHNQRTKRNTRHSLPGSPQKVEAKSESKM